MSLTLNREKKLHGLTPCTKAQESIMLRTLYIMLGANEQLYSIRMARRRVILLTTFIHNVESKRQRATFDTEKWQVSVLCLGGVSDLSPTKKSAAFLEQ